MRMGRGVNILKRSRSAEESLKDIAVCVGILSEYFC